MKITNTFIFCFLIFSLVALKLNAQTFTLSTGISKDINNSKISFYHIPLSLMWKPGKKEFSPLVELNYSVPLTAKSNVNAYTLNPNLAEKVTLTENITPRLFSAAFGFAIQLVSRNQNSLYLDLFPFGILSQKIKIQYKNYDRENYEVLNPDVTVNKTIFELAAAVVYNFNISKRNLMVMLHIQTGTSDHDGDYKLSYNPIVPLQLTFGYNFYYKK